MVLDEKPYQIMKQWTLRFAQSGLSDLWVILLKAADKVTVPVIRSRRTDP